MVQEYLEQKPDYVDLVRNLVEYEEKNKCPDHAFIDDKEYDCCWTSKDVHEHPSRLYQLEMNGVLDRVFDSNSTTAYSIKNRNEVKDLVMDIDETYDDDIDTVMHDFPSEKELSDDVFDDVIGHDEAKWLLKRGLTSDSITNFLLVGPPGCAKSVFLMCIEELGGSEFIVGPDAKAAGFNDVMFENKPKYMLIDELDDMPLKDQKSLSSYTETGIVKETKYKKTREMRTNTKTFATANSTSDILQHIEDRFLVLNFSEYTKDEYIEVCRHIIPRKEDATEDEAEIIANAVWERRGSGDVRDAIAVSRLSRGDPEKVISALDAYSESSLKSLLG